MDIQALWIRWLWVDGLVSGRGARVVQYLTAADKTYEATVELGAESDTYDAEGEIKRLVSSEQTSAISTEVVRDALSTFSGWIEQVPPAFSRSKLTVNACMQRHDVAKGNHNRQVRIDRCELKSVRT